MLTNANLILSDGNLAAALDPFAVAIKLSRVNLYSIRIGHYRIMVSIGKNKLILFVVDS